MSPPPDTTYYLLLCDKLLCESLGGQVGCATTAQPVIAPRLDNLTALCLEVYSSALDHRAAYGAAVPVPVVPPRPPHCAT